MKKARQLSLLALLIVLCVCLFQTSASAASKVKLSKSKASLYIGETLKLKVSGTSKTVKWSSSDKTIATVSSSGKIKAKKAGTATITAKVGGKKYTCKVTVKSALKVSSTSKSLSYDGSSSVTCTFKGEGSIEFSVSDSSIVSCQWGSWSSDGKGKIKLKITALKPGTATITISNTFNSEKKKIKVTVKKPSLKVSTTSISVPWTDASTSFTVTSKSGVSISCESSDTDVATVATVTSGTTTTVKVTPNSPGTSTITVTDEFGTSKTVKVTVTGGITIEMPSLPQKIHYYSSSGTLKSSAIVTDITYDVTYYKSSKTATVYLYFAGTKTYGSTTTSEACRIGWKLYKNNAVVASDVVYTTSVALGESFASVKEYIFDLTDGEYTLKILDVK